MHGQSPLVRQWLLLKTLGNRPEGVTVRRLVEELGVSDKTIRRDLEAFQQAGFPLSETTGPHGQKTWRLDGQAGVPDASFTFDEAAALCLARQLLEPLAGTVLWEAACRAIRKVRAGLKPDGVAQKYLDRFAGLFHQTSGGASDYSKKGDLIERLTVAIEDRKAVFITYQSRQATEPVTYDLYAYGFVWHHGSLYLVGHSPDHNEIRHWKVDRIEQVDLTEVRFQRPEDFDLEKHLSGSFGIWEGRDEICVHIRFSPAAARYVKEKRWHPSPRLASQPDGSLIAEFRLGATQEIKAWALSFGKEAEVLSPRNLREEIAADLQTLLTTYTRRPVPSPASAPKPRSRPKPRATPGQSEKEGRR